MRHTEKEDKCIIMMGVLCTPETHQTLNVNAQKVVHYEKISKGTASLAGMKADLSQETIKW